MKPETTLPAAHEHCVGCVYFPPNLPQNAYPAEDFSMLQQKSCSFDFQPLDTNCAVTRKTSCSLVDLNPATNLLKHTLKTGEIT